MSHWAGRWSGICSLSVTIPPHCPPNGRQSGSQGPLFIEKETRPGEKSSLSRTPRFPDSPKQLPTFSHRWPPKKTYHPQHKRVLRSVYMWDSQHHVARMSHKWLGHPLWDSVSKPRSRTTGQDYLLCPWRLERLLSSRPFFLWVSCPR